MLCFLCIVVSDTCCVVLFCAMLCPTHVVFSVYSCVRHILCCVFCASLCPTHVMLCCFVHSCVRHMLCCVFTLFFSSSYVANFSVLSIFDSIFGVLESFIFQLRKSYVFLLCSVN